MDISFAAAADPTFNQLKTDDRLRYAHKNHPKLALTSSFGIQSIAMIELLDRLGIELPVISIDIKGDQYDTQRRYRDRLEGLYGFDLQVVKITDEAEKSSALEEKLGQLGTTATLDG